MLRRCCILSVGSYILAAGGEQRAGKFMLCMYTETCLHRISLALAQLKYIPLITAQAQCKKTKQKPDAHTHLLRRTKKCFSSFSSKLTL